MKYVNFLVLIFLLNSAVCLAQYRQLNIPPVIQSTQVWCWVAVGEMIFRYEGVGQINPSNYQCGIIALVHPVCGNSCMNCIIPAGEARIIHNMLNVYPSFARSMFGFGPSGVSSTLLYSAVSEQTIINQIDAGMPIITGISPSGIRSIEPAHVALITGYRQIDNNLFLVINDPYPYQLTQSRNPYFLAGGRCLKMGQYLIDYKNFMYLNWQVSFTDIQSY